VVVEFRMTPLDAVALGDRENEREGKTKPGRRRVSARPDFFWGRFIYSVVFRAATLSVTFSG
jgi:hypothetical protein